MKKYAEFYKALRKIGFKRAYQYKEGGSLAVVQYERTNEHGVKVDVQFWRDGLKRVSNMHPTDNSPNEPAAMNSPPSIFKSIKGMSEAISFEETRWASLVSKDIQKDFQ